MFFTTLGLYKILYMAELLLTFFLYARKLRRRDRFALRVAGVSAAGLVVAAFFPVPVFSWWYTSFVFTALFALLLGGAMLCFKEKFISIVYCGLAAYTTRHAAFQVFGFLRTGFDMLISQANDTLIYSLYGGADVKEFFSDINFVWAMLYVGVYLLVYSLIFMFFGKRIWRNPDLKIKNSSLLLLSGIIMFVNVLLHSILVYESDTVSVYILLIYVYNIMCCAFIFYMMSTIVDMKQLKQELVLLRHLGEMEKQQYEEHSRNMELINMRCHDIKHQIHSHMFEKSDDYLRELDELINVYNTSVKTGNRELDIILTQKSLFCAKNDISFDCVADGSGLSFMDRTDIYSLFGNIMDNAIESVIKSENVDRRVIDFSVRSEKNIVAVRVSNYYEGEIRFDSHGLPVTTKTDKELHGYGMKSISSIVEKYGGDLDITAKDGIFSVGIILICGNADAGAAICE